MDVRPGGSWGATLITEDGTRFPGGSVTFTDLGDETELTVRQSSGHLTGERYEQARDGTSSFLDRMAELLARP